MTHYKSLVEQTDYLGPQNFEQPKELTISRIASEKYGDKNPKSTPMMYFSYNDKELPLKYKVPMTVYYGLSQVFGTDVDTWAGKKVTLYTTKCKSFNEIEECVRIVFTPAIEKLIMKYLKKRKCDPEIYRLRGESCPAILPQGESST